ncbi:fumarylacetoacetase [Azospirillum endophyticum]
MIDHTNDPTRSSWVSSANGHADFPIQNLPFGVFDSGDGRPRGGVAIGEAILDLGAALKAGLFPKGTERAALAGSQPTLNALMSLGSGARADLRRAVFDLLDSTTPMGERAASLAATLLHPGSGCRMHLPARIGGYTDFYAGIHHALNVGRLFRPDAPLLPNYKHVPIGYNGRASSIRVSGTRIVRPRGQTKPVTTPRPEFGPTQQLDFELELGIWIGTGNRLGEPISIHRATNHVWGFSLLNDWSARDIQAWEYQPLGPFLAKSFATTVSPWIVTPEALAPFRTAMTREEDDPSPLPYLFDAEDQRTGGLDIELSVWLATKAHRSEGTPPDRLSLSNAKHLYWSAAQMVAHHTSNGGNLDPGDLLGSGTISTARGEGFGSLLEITQGGKVNLQLPSGQIRRFLEDGDQVILTATCRKPGFVSLGFGRCEGQIAGALN